MAPRPPPAALARPDTVTLPVGATAERVHDRRYGANEFNPCRGAPTRFAPIRDADGACVPSLYAASTLEAAIHETVFHDIPVGAGRATVPRGLVEGRAHGRLEVLRDLRLASLRAPDLRRWRIARNALIAAPPRLYPETAGWAAAIHDRFPDVDGLVWTSNRCDPDSAYLFFGDRAGAEDFRVAEARDGRADTTFLADVREAGGRCGVVIAV